MYVGVGDGDVGVGDLGVGDVGDVVISSYLLRYFNCYRQY